MKSGYWVVMEEERTGGTQQVDLNVLKYWKHLWKLKVPPKMNHFLWNCSTGFMPCLWSLYYRYITDHSMCPRCKQADETPLHVTWLCPGSVAVLEIGEGRVL